MANNSSYDPFEHADQLGLTILYGRLRASNGLWIPDHRTIILQPRMRAIQERSVLAHEIAHADLGHRDNRAKHEVLADRYAAEHLIDLQKYRELVQWTPDVARLSLELGVTTKLMQVYANVHRHDLNELDFTRAS
ncbi:MAG: ImmA/IrrE family metallo-endopeptidase [Patescibacteria group bacterium]|nr:ImmA/IrrE family metallo-endopeptidase [Patescibacteria group bacterium]